MTPASVTNPHSSRSVIFIPTSKNVRRFSTRLSVADGHDQRNHCDNRRSHDHENLPTTVVLVLMEVAKLMNHRRSLRTILLLAVQLLMIRLCILHRDCQIAMILNAMWEINLISQILADNARVSHQLTDSNRQNQRLEKDNRTMMSLLDETLSTSEASLQSDEVRERTSVSADGQDSSAEIVAASARAVQEAQDSRGRLEERLCICCLDEDRSAIFECGHLTTCMACTQNLPVPAGHVRKRCPVCRAPGTARKVFYA